MAKNSDLLQEAQIRSARFRTEREEGWKKLQSLVERAEKGGVKNLSYQEALDLNQLYQSAMNSLSTARAISMDQALIEYLDKLCARAYLIVYAPQKSLRGVIGHFLVYGLPQSVRQSWLALIIGFSAILIGTLIGFMLFNQDHSWYYSFIPSSYADGRTPEATAEYLRSTLYNETPTNSQRAGLFSSFLYSHNTRIAIFVFGLGVFGLLPSYLLTFYQGLLLGAFYGNFADKGLGFDVFAWLSIHGVTEISAICVACAAGSKLGLAVMVPGNLSRRQSLYKNGRDATKLILLAMIMLTVAAFVEGYLRQSITDPYWRLGIGWGLGLFWVLWLSLSGREGQKS